MDNKKVFIGSKVDKKIVEYVNKYFECEMWQEKGQISKKQLMDKIKDVSALIVSGDVKIDEEIISSAPKLEVISNIAVGYNNLDLKAMKSSKIIGTNTPYVLDNSVADLIFGLILSSARRIVELDKYVKDGKWEKGSSEKLYGIEVHNKTIGIIGMGRIGEAVAKRAKLGFDMDVLYYNRHRKIETENKLGAKYSSLEDLLKKADYIVIMTPLTRETYRLIDYKEFSMMKNSAVFINASRGKTVNEEALIDALKNKKIYAAGLDVYETEPAKKDNALLSMDNVVSLPHIGSATAETRFDMAMLAAKNSVNVLKGQQPISPVPELKKM
ncbi:MAG: D-glycerate dehydrogenase [Clostridium sp.]|nr:D-glycerate dehydrogenase [Clostridium sp.]